MRIRVVRPAARLALSAALAGTAVPAYAQVGATDAADIDVLAESFVARPMVPGLAVGIVVDDELVHAVGYGVADRATGRAVGPGSIFQIGSASKALTSTLFAILAERGKLGWDDPLSDHLPPDVPAPSYEGRVPTLSEIASHTAGFPRDAPTLRRAHGDAPVLAFTHFELYRSLEETELAFAPGSDWSYSNFGFGVLGHALERASGMPYETLLFRELQLPLRMMSTTVTLWPRFDSLLARPYYPNAEADRLEDYTPWDSEALAPAGGVASSVADLASFLRLHLGGGTTRLLESGGLARLHGPTVAIDEGRSYGFGWFGRELEGVGRIVEHGGEVDGYTTFLGFAPERGVGVILLVNAGNAPVGELADEIFRRVVGGG